MKMNSITLLILCLVLFVGSIESCSPADCAAKLAQIIGSNLQRSITQHSQQVVKDALSLAKDVKNSLSVEQQASGQINSVHSYVSNYSPVIISNQVSSSIINNNNVNINNINNVNTNIINNNQLPRNPSRLTKSKEEDTLKALYVLGTVAGWIGAAIEQRRAEKNELGTDPWHK